MSCIGIVVVLFVGLVALTGQHWAIQQAPPDGPVGDSTTVALATPLPGDLAGVRRDLARLAVVVTSPTAATVDLRPSAAGQARTLRQRLIVWRDGFDLTAHQTLVVDHAVAYAGALERWLGAPRSASRRAAALRAWRAWRAADPVMRTT